MYTREDILTVVQVIATLSDIEVKDTYGVNLFHFVVAATQRYMLRDSLRYTVEDTLEECKFARVLYFHDDDLTLAVFSLDVYTVEFIVDSQLVAFALQQFDDLHLFVQQHRQKTFQHAEIGFLTQQALDRPVETDIIIFHKAIRLVYLQCICKCNQSRAISPDCSLTIFSSNPQYVKDRF